MEKPILEVAVRQTPNGNVFKYLYDENDDHKDGVDEPFSLVNDYFLNPNKSIKELSDLESKLPNLNSSFFIVFREYSFNKINIKLHIDKFRFLVYHMKTLRGLYLSAILFHNIEYSLENEDLYDDYFMMLKHSEIREFALYAIMSHPQYHQMCFELLKEIKHCSDEDILDLLLDKDSLFFTVNKERNEIPNSNYFNYDMDENIVIDLSKTKLRNILKKPLGLQYEDIATFVKKFEEIINPVTFLILDIVDFCKEVRLDDEDDLRIKILAVLATTKSKQAFKAALLLFNGYALELSKQLLHLFSHLASYEELTYAAFSCLEKVAGFQDIVRDVLPSLSGRGLCEGFLFLKKSKKNEKFIRENLRFSCEEKEAQYLTEILDYLNVEEYLKRHLSDEEIDFIIKVLYCLASPGNATYFYSYPNMVSILYTVADKFYSTGKVDNEELPVFFKYQLNFVQLSEDKREDFEECFLYFKEKLDLSVVKDRVFFSLLNPESDPLMNSLKMRYYSLDLKDEAAKLFHQNPVLNFAYLTYLEDMNEDTSLLISPFENALKLKKDGFDLSTFVTSDELDINTEIAFYFALVDYLFICRQYHDKLYRGGMRSRYPRLRLIFYQALYNNEYIDDEYKKLLFSDIIHDEKEEHVKDYISECLVLLQGMA